MIRMWGKSRRQLIREIRREQYAGLIGEAVGCLTVIVWRFLSGDYLDGVARTNATWTARATVAYTPSGRASAWASLARFERAATRSGALLLVGLARLAYTVNPGMTTIIVRAGVIAFVPIAVAYGVTRLLPR